MKSTEFIREVITSPARDEYIDQYAACFSKSPVIDTNNGVALKQVSNDENIMYGLFDQNNPTTIVGILILRSYNDKYWQVELSQIEERFKGQGFGTYLYDYAIMNDGLSVLSDSHQTEHSNGSSWQLWCRLYGHGRYKVCGYDLTTDTILPDANPNAIKNQKDNIVWLATPKGERIHEMLSRFNDPAYRMSARSRTIMWYGPETLNKNRDNY